MSSSAKASSRSASSRPSGRQKCRLAPVRSASASATWSITASPPNSWLIWKVRARPSRTRACCGRWVMSAPRRQIRPALGGSAPVIRLISVVLPAPFGPISAWRAPCAQPEVDAVGHPQRAEALAQAKRLQRRRLRPRRRRRSPGAVPLTLGQPLAPNLPEFAGPCDPGNPCASRRRDGDGDSHGRMDQPKARTTR